MRIELHCHSTRSDGSETPTRIGQWCRDRDVRLMALTDHDTCRGVAEAQASFGDRPFVDAVELSCADQGRSVHLLLYRPPATRDTDRWTDLQDHLEAAHKARRQRVRTIAARLEQAGIAIDVDDLLADSEGRSIGRPDLARALVKSGAVRNARQAFDRYLGDGKPFDEPLARLSVAEGVELGRAVGARVALAHPHTLDDRAEPLLRAHRDAGLSGLEVYYGQYGRKQRARFRALADELGLVPTGGSDFHGAALPQVERPGIDVDDRVAKTLVDWLGVTL